MRKIIFWSSITILGVFAMYLIYSIVVFQNINEHRELSLFGAFGDSFGALNTLFSGLALSAVAISIFLQAKELKDTREEIEGQKKALEMQAETLEKQNFENTFFQLLKFQQDIHLSFPNPPFYQNTNLLHGWSLRIQNILNSKPIYDKIETFFFENTFLNQYFFGLEIIMKLIDTSNRKNKEDYIQILRSQLSNHELRIIFYRCISLVGKGDFKKLIEKYAILQNLNIKYISYPEKSEDIGLEAFGSNQEEWKIKLSSSRGHPCL